MPRIENWKKASDRNIKNSVSSALPSPARVGDAWYYTESGFEEKVTYVAIARFNRARTSDHFRVYEVVGDRNPEVRKLNIQSSNLREARKNTVEWLRNHPNP